MKICRIILNLLDFRNTIKILKMRPAPFNNFLKIINAYHKTKKTQPFDKNLTNYEQNTNKVKDN